MTPHDVFEYDPVTGDFFVVKERRGAPRTPRLIRRLVTYVDGRGYLKVRFDGKMYAVHRLIFVLMTGSFPKGEVDHISGDKCDNRWVNLRDVPVIANRHNKGVRVDSVSGVTGVWWSKGRQRWQAYIRHENIQHHLGYFKEMSDAVVARHAAEREYGFHPNHGKRPSWRG